MAATVTPQPFEDAAVAVFRFDDLPAAKSENLADASAPALIRNARSADGYAHTGKALVSDNDAFASIPALPRLEGRSAVTVSLWFETPRPQPGSVLLDRDGRPGSGFRLDFDSTGTLPGFACATEPGARLAASAKHPIADGRWHHLVASCEAGAVRLLIDGRDETVSTLREGVSFMSGALYMGRAHDGTGVFEGSIDELRVYDRALGTEEMTIAP
jgi:hypothetical protein